MRGGTQDGIKGLNSSTRSVNIKPAQVKNVQSVLLGKYEVETWYFSPYPDDYSKLDKVTTGLVDLSLALTCRSCVRASCP